MNYHKLLIRQETYNGQGYTPVSPQTIVDTYANWKVVCEEFPFKYLPETKDIASRDWHDEDGEDTYIPSDGMKFKAYDLEVMFLYAGTNNAIHAHVKGFINFIYGRNQAGYSSSPLLAVYDEYTKIGMHGLYVKEVGDELFDISDRDPDAIARFKVTFRVTDPTSSWAGGTPGTSSSSS